jgi:hypothetical protein
VVDVVEYKIPKTQILVIDENNEVPVFAPELTIIAFNKDQKQRYLRIYRFCYLDRLSFDPSVKSHKESFAVNLLSICTARVELARKIVIDIFNGVLSKGVSVHLQAIFDWIDFNKLSYHLYTPEGCNNLYRTYSNYLTHRIRLSNVGEKKKDAIGYSMAQQCQRALAYLIERASGIDWQTIRIWAPAIPQKKNQQYSGPSTTDDEHSLSYALHSRFFDAFSTAVIEGAPPPVVVPLSDLGFEDVIYYNQHANSANGWSSGRKGLSADWMPYFYGRNGLFEGSNREFYELLRSHGVKPPMSINKIKVMRNSNRVFSKATIREIANHATRHFGYLLLAEAGNNAAHLSTIDCSNLRLEKAIGAFRTVAVKARSGYEDQDQFVDVRFAKTYWKKYLKLREIMARGIDAPERGLFILGGRVDRDPYTLLTATSLRQLSLWPKNAPSLEIRAARKHKVVSLVEGSDGNVALAANLMFARPQTVEKHYAFKNQIEAAKEMSDYFEVQAASAKLRYSGVQPVRIIQKGEQIASGRCDVSDTEAPTLMEGFENQVPYPRCGSPLTCMFCSHFGLHADEEDLVRLLSIIKWISIQSCRASQNIDEHMQKYAGFIDRINQIIEAFSNMGDSHAKMVDQAHKRVENGNLDPYWHAKINAIIEIEEA